MKILVANTALTYGGHKYGTGMQFNCEDAAVGALVSSGQASVAPPPARKTPAAGPAQTPGPAAEVIVDATRPATSPPIK